MKFPIKAESELVRDTASPAELTVLDDPQEWSAFSRQQAANVSVWESDVVVLGMYCAACAVGIEDALKQVNGVLRVEVSATSGRARVVWSAALTRPSQWLRAIEAAGYHALPANDTSLRQHRQSEARKLLWRWSVAGLCMMQVMMYALPAYVAAPGDLTAEMEHLLRWASWLLSLPVLLFSCTAFFTNAWADVLRRRLSMDLPVSLGMLITFAVSSAGTFEPQGLFGQQVYFDSFTMFVFFLLTGRWLELRLRQRTAGALDALLNRLPETVARRKADGSFERVAVRRIAVGDVIRVLPGEAFPADGRVLSGSTVVDEALLTGESRPLRRDAGSAVIAGSHNLAAALEVEVEHIGPQTRFAQIVALLASAASSKPALARLADRIARPFLLLVLLAAALAAAFWWHAGPAHALMVAVAVLVVTCPCALSLATPAAMLAAAGNLARHGVLVRQLDALEALAAIDTVLFDKTGTLTRDGMALAQTRTRSGTSHAQALALAAALAQHSLHPASKALCSAAGQLQVRPVSVEGVTEVAGQGLAGRVPSSSPEMPGAALRLGSAVFCGVPAAQASDQPQVYLSDAQGWLATFVLQEELRDYARDAVAALGAAGIEVHLLSGDAVGAVARVASQLGIDHFQAACTPQSKLDFLHRQQQRGRRVAVVGDGINDTPMLAAAQVSFAFGGSLALVSEQADFLLPAGDCKTLLHALALARRARTVVWQNLSWAAIYNASCVPLALLGWLPAWLAGLGMALSSLLVVLNALRLSTTPTA